MQFDIKIGIFEKKHKNEAYFVRLDKYLFLHGYSSLKKYDPNPTKPIWFSTEREHNMSLPKAVQNTI